MEKKKQLLLATVSVLPLVFFAGNTALWAQTQEKSPEEKCVAGEQCLVEDGATIRRSSQRYVGKELGGGIPALVVKDKSTFNGTSIILSKAGENGNAASFSDNSTVELDNLQSDGSVVGSGTAKLKNSTIKAIDYALAFYGGDYTLDKVYITATGKEGELTGSGIQLSPSSDSVFTMNGGSIVSDASSSGVSIQSLFGASEFHFNDVAITSSGMVTFDADLKSGSVLNILGGTIVSKSDSMSWAVDLQGGETLIDGTKITSNNIGLLVGNEIDHTQLVMRNFKINTKGDGHLMTGMDITGDVDVRLEKGTIKTQGGFGVSVRSASSSQPLAVERVKIETSGDMSTSHGLVNNSGLVTLDDVDIYVKSNSYGIWSNGYGIINGGLGSTNAHIDMFGGSITVDGEGGSVGAVSAAYASDGGKIGLNGVSIETKNDVSGVGVGHDSVAGRKIRARAFSGCCDFYLRYRSISLHEG